MQDSKLRLRKNAHHVASDCEEGGTSSLKGHQSSDRLDFMGASSSNSNSHHSMSIKTSASFGTSDPLSNTNNHSHNANNPISSSASSTTAQSKRLAPSYGAIRGRRKRRRRRESIKKQCEICLKGLAATVVSVTLSLLLLPFSWIQVDYHHQVQHELQYLVQVLKDTRSNSKTLFRGIHSRKPPRQIVCNDGFTLAIENDNYCDCPDGRDELLTSACSHLLVDKRVFVCHDPASTKIFASRVNDGIIDCPDGSDETTTSASSKASAKAVVATVSKSSTAKS
jgi:Glucosidase II beta subunit-like